jgi:hypothetical protein
VRPTIRILGKLALLLIATLAGSAAQANDAITAVNNEVGLSIGGENISYHEWQSGSSIPTQPDGYLDSNYGTMPAVGLSLTRQGSIFSISNIYTALSVQGAFGRTQYSGSMSHSICSGTPGTGLDDTRSCGVKWEPYRTSTSDDTLDVSARIGKAFPLGARAQITPYVVFGAHAWNRNVPWLNGDDVYWNLIGGVGGLGQYALTNRLVLGLDVGALESFAANAHENGLDFHLASRPMLTGTLSADYAATKHLHLTASYSVAHYRYGGSPSVCIGESCSFEPDSLTTTQTVMVGIAYSYR